MPRWVGTPGHPACLIAPEREYVSPSQYLGMVMLISWRAGLPLKSYTPKLPPGSDLKNVPSSPS